MRILPLHRAAAAIALLASAACMSSNQQQASAGASGAAAPSGSTTASMATSGEWRALFDGTSTDAWRGYRAQAMPGQGWKIEDGLLVHTRAGGGGDIVTKERFRDFELELEWKVAPGGNSGVMYRVTEDAEHTYESGPEMQVLDDSGHADGRNALTSAGALYGLYPAPRGVVKRAGEWNQARIVVRGAHVEHWLNGTKVAEAEMNSPEWNEKVRASKFAEWPGYGKAPEGHIALQDHGDWVAYRNIRVRRL